MERFARKSVFYSIEFFRFFAQRRKSVEKMNYRKKNRGHQASKILNPLKAMAMAIFPINVHFIARALDAHDVACEFRAQ